MGPLLPRLVPEATGAGTVVFTINQEDVCES
jgi:hypothetical protein